MEIRTVDPFYSLILSDDGNFLGHWMVVLYSWLHRCLHNSGFFFLALCVCAQSHHTCCSDHAIWVFLIFMRILLPLDPDPIDCVNGLVRVVWKVAFCIYLFIPGILNPSPTRIILSSISWILASGTPCVPGKY
jgi:hypothetical protein